MRFVILVQRHDGRQQHVGSAPELTALARGGEVAGMAVVSREDTGLYLDACRDWLTRAGGVIDRCVLCVRPRRPPVAFARPDQPVESFACCGPLCSHLAEALRTPGDLVSAFEVVREIMRAPRPVRVRVCVQPEEIRDAASPPVLTPISTRPRVAWVMAHLGPRDYLRGCLDGIVLANQPLDGAILVGLDDDRPLPEAELCERAGGRAYFADPPRSGPYRIRNALIDRTEADMILLQDSDDFPCEDRGVCLVDALHHSTHGMAGSHALNIDERRRRIVPVRYPLDATAAQQRDGEDPVLPGACAVRRAAFLDAGGFSTLATYAMDSQFVLRGHFHFSTINVDRFLYLRRIRAGSLTTDGPTMYGSLGRSRLTHLWQRDFPRVMQGRLRLAESSLRVQHPLEAAFALRVPQADSGGEFMTGRSRTLRRFWALLAPFRGTIFLLFGLALVSAGVQMTQPYLYHFAIDEVAMNRSVAPETRLVWLAQVFGAMITLIGVSFVASYYNSYRTHALNHIVTARLRHKLLKHMLRLPLHALVTMKTGGAVARLNQDTEKVSQTVHRSIITPGVAIVQVAVGLALVFALNWRLALASVVIIVPLALLTHRTGRRLRPLFSEISKMGNELSARTVEMFGGIRVSRLYGREIAERRTYLRMYHRVIRKNLAVRRRQLGINTFTSLSFAFIQVIIVSLGVYLIIYDLATVGDIFAIVVYSNRIAGPIDQVITSYQQVQEDLGVLDRIFEVFDIEQDKFEHVTTVEAPEKVESVSFEGVGFSYNGNNRKALSDIQLHIPGGTTVALVGKSGAGKSTLTDLLSRFYEPQEGAIRLNGRNVREIELKSYRRLLGLVQQETFLFDGTVRENIAYAVPHASEADVLEAAQRANADEFIVRLPKCYDTVIGERGVRLSGGQRQRISMARAFLVDPEILILDEATSNLDTENEQMIQQAMKELLKDRTTFIIAHRLSTVTHADTIVVLDEGQIREIGTHTELLANRGPYYDMIALQHKADRF